MSDTRDRKIMEFTIWKCRKHVRTPIALNRYTYFIDLSRRFYTRARNARMYTRTDEPHANE